ncbi:unnamed protein product [Lupinus luteus]|uniref:PA domain-containing protein n=1 Tax=Lupinus luteus TaxID=3873 RepID=A0AAV1WG89_LUPLU
MVFMPITEVINFEGYSGANLFVNLPPKKSFPLILSTDAKIPNVTFQDAQVCKAETLDSSKVNCKVVICVRCGKVKSVAEGQEALSAGAIGVVKSNDDQSGNTILVEPHVLSTKNTVEL